MEYTFRINFIDNDGEIFDHTQITTESDNYMDALKDVESLSELKMIDYDANNFESILIGVS
jgi:hypothetical protein